ncbi:MAG: urea transporter, urea binding protein [Bacillota bacterium]|nr:urea transporter, urea binding protein [Bacillota bacterium]
MPNQRGNLEVRIMKKRTTQFLVLLLVMSLVLGLSACGGAAKGGDTAKIDKNKEFILVGRVAPLTGPLASFGNGTPFMEENAVEALNADGGIYIEELGKKLPIKFIVLDSESNTTKAAEAANKLILEEKVDLMIVSHTVDTVNPVSAACERYKVPCISVDAPVDAWLAGAPYTYSYHAFFNSERELNCFIDAWDLQDTNKKVGLLAPNDAEGIQFAQDVTKYAEERGYTVVDPGRFPIGNNDYTSIINNLKKEDIDILVGVMITPDFATAWKQFHQQGVIPKVVTVAKATLFPADVEALGGDLGNGVVSEVWWTKNHPFTSSLTGQTAAQLAEMWEKELGQPSVATTGYKHANVELLVDVLNRAQSLDKQKILDAIAATDLDTVVGHVKYGEDHACVMNLVTGQWVKNSDGVWEQRIIANTQIPDVPLYEGEMIAIPGSN